MGIGVTEFITRSEVRNRIARTYPNPGTDVSGDLVVEHESYEHSLLGQAFDYLIRIWLEAQCNEVHDPHEGRYGGNWTTNLGYTRSSYSSGTDSVSKWSPKSKEEQERINTALERAERKHQQFLQTGMNLNNAIDAALVYSGLDLNVGLEEGGQIDANSFEDDVVTELQELAHLLQKQDSRVGDSLIVSPDFGERSFILEGHGDIIVDDTLIEVKTTEDPTFTPDYWRQLLAYYVLNDIHRLLTDQDVDGYGKDIPYPELTTVGVYFARFGVLQTVDITGILTPRNEYERFRAWFVDRAIEQNRDGRRNYDPYTELLTEPYEFEDQTSLFDF